MRTRLFGLSILIMMLLACKLITPATGNTTPPQSGLSMLEMLNLAEPAMKEWSGNHDVFISRNIHCQGVLTTDGRCNQWVAEIYSPANNMTGVIESYDTIATVKSVYLYQPEKYIINRSDLIDSTTIVPTAVMWVKARNLWQENTVTDGFTVQIDNTDCGEGLFYIVNFSLPIISLCVQPSTGKVTKCIGVSCKQ